MAILAVAKDLADMRERMGKIVVAYDKQGKPVTTEDLEVAGAMTAWMAEALNPNLLQTLEGQPVFVHAGPFANIAIGQSSILADRVALKLSDYHVTESGFGADIGFEKFWNLKCRFSGLKPHCAVVVATIRALKCHGGAPIPVPGKPMPEEYSGENVGWVEEGLRQPGAPHRDRQKSRHQPGGLHQRLLHRHRQRDRRGAPPGEAAGARVALSRHWEHGGEGAMEFADAVKEACEEKNDFKLLYDLEMPLRQAH
jgi:formyltetrahydrofolate synthetase